MPPGVGLGETSPARRSTYFKVFALGLGLAIVLRLLLLSTDGLRGDLDQFVLWVHGLATQPFGQAYDQNLSFPPVMVYVWGVLAALEPAFRTVTDAADPMIRAVMKTPASLADLAIGLLVAWELRGRPLWAVVAGLGILLHPAFIDVSAWWGQYESIYTLFGLIAFVLAVRGHSLAAAAVLGVALMTKPQALPFVVPFAAWFLARDGMRGAVLAGIVGGAVVALLWAPFLAAGGPAGYARNLGEYQGDIFAILSIRAWNAWWLVQEAFAGGQFVSDQTAILGPVTLRHLGYLAAGALELVVFAAVYRRPTRETLALGLAAAVLVAFTFLTTMHERYSYGAMIFLTLLLPDRRILGLWLAFGVVFTINLLAAVPPTPEIAAVLPVRGPLGIAGSVAMLGISLATLALLLRPSPSETAETTDEGDSVPVEVMG
jgi:dolichyl-phosphate-mannose-protein mannosyltransferase